MSIPVSRCSTSMLLLLIFTPIAHGQQKSSAAQSDDLHIKKSITVGGNFVSASESSISGARERTVTQTPNGTTITLRQCDLKRTVTLNEQSQTYMVTPDAQDENAVKAAALAAGQPAAEANGGKIVLTTTVTDTGERKTMYGYQVRHLKAKVVQEPSQDACTQVRQMFQIDGWFADISKEQAACMSFAPPVQQGTGCSDKLIEKRVGSGKPGYPIQENITMATPDGGTMTIGLLTSELTKQEKLPAEMFDVPTGYRQVSSTAELNGAVPQAAPPSQMTQAAAPAPQQPIPQGGAQASAAAMKSTLLSGMLNPMAAPAANQAAMAQMQRQMAMMQGGGMPQMGGMPPVNGGNQPAGSQIAAPQALGPKAPGKIRIGVAPPDAQVGQGNNTGGDYSTPIRNAEIALMSGPAIEVAGLDSHIAMQLQAEAQQKQCDYILISSVEVKHSTGGGFGKFAKFGSMAASMTPMGAMAHGMGGAIAAQGAAMAASQMAQKQAMNQLAGFTGQIKSKDDVTVQYQLVPTGQSAPLVQNSLKGKAKSDGEDVLTPLLQQTASEVLGAAAKK
ncbi:hypothetical protein [Occallatibacter savannae]|uniref:hypothetical protein n=1 Tax=Occallatibacter savannae TaxID=1002691 RepID=UPI000D68F87B|nr:hypothetical protein [Occallatibacter savannae]